MNLVNINLGLPLYRGEPIMKKKHHNEIKKEKERSN